MTDEFFTIFKIHVVKVFQKMKNLIHVIRGNNDASKSPSEVKLYPGMLRGVIKREWR